MKWTNKGHQFDATAKALITQLENKKIYLFGAAMAGRELYPVVKRMGVFGGFIDNDTEKQIGGYLDERVYSWNEYDTRKEKGIVILCAGPKNRRKIKEQLTDCGLEHGKDFFDHEHFAEFILPIVFLYSYGKCFVTVSQIVLTSRCTLSCKKCAHGCQVHTRSQELSVKEACKSADYLFEKVDYVKDFVLIGGEPLLYQNLDQVIEYIGSRYRDRIFNFGITTNGTLLPSDDVIECARKYGLVFTVSDYSITLPGMGDKILTLEKLLMDNGVKYNVIRYDEWVDYGFDSVFKDDSKAHMISFFDACQTPCHEIRNNRFYYCVGERASGAAYGFTPPQDDFLDFSKLEGDYHKIILEYCLGYSEKGYMEMCRRCNGSFKHNPHVIPPALQMEGNAGCV